MTKTERKVLLGLALTFIVGLGLAAGGCNTQTEGPTTTNPVAEATPEPVVVAPAPQTPAVVDPVTQPADPQVECYVGNGGSFYVRTKGGVARQYVAWTTSFDNQDLPLAVKGPVIRQPGDSWEDSFATKCHQVDVGGVLNGTPICFGFIDNLGKKVPRIDAGIRAACSAKPCVEPREVPTTPGAYSWSDEVLEGQCEQEALPVVIDTVTPSLNCHQTGTQKWTIDYQCQDDGERVAHLCRNVACATPPPCVETWIEQSPTITTSEWSSCVLGEQSRTIRTVILELNSCTQETRVKSDTMRTEKRDCQTPGLCYYKVSGGNETFKRFVCEASKGFPFFGGGGHWINFDGSKLDNHCEIGFPGISQNNFQLTPGQSAPGCLNKNDD